LSSFLPNLIKAEKQIYSELDSISPLEENNTVFIKFSEVEGRRFFIKYFKSEQKVKEDLVNVIGEENINHDFGNLISANLDSEKIKEIEDIEGVIEITPVGKKHIMLQNVNTIINSSRSWSLQSGGAYNLTGEGQTICIIDTGINYSHSDLGGCYGNNNVSSSCKILGGIDYCPNDVDCSEGGTDTNPMDVQGHGTHVAGIAAANGSISGVAPGAKIIMIKASNSTGSFWDDDLVAGINWCVGNSSTYNISVISMSLGGGIYTGYCDEELDETEFVTPINSAIAKNISVVIASGNDGYYNAISSPACIQNATPISASTKLDAIGDYANTNNITQLLAPGGSDNTQTNGINSTCITGSYCGKYGTSMAAPAAAGAFAIINQYLKIKNITRTPSQIEDVFNSTGKQITDVVYSNLTFSRINVYEALLSLDLDSPSIGLVYPSNNYISPSTNITLRCNATDWQLSNITFYLWNSTSVVNQTTISLKGTFNQTEINITGLSLENYRWNCLAKDNKSNSGIFSSNYTFNLGNISLALDSPANNSYSSSNLSFFNCSSSVSNLFSLRNITFYLWNSSNSLIYNYTKAVYGTSNSSSSNYTFTNQELYYWNCISGSNISEYKTYSSNYSFTFDMASPNVNLLSPENSASYSTSDTIYFSYNVSDNFAIENCSLIINGAINSTNSSLVNLSTSNNFSLTLSAGTYSWNVNCSDKSGNLNSSSSRSISVSAPVQTPASGGGGGGGGSNTYSPSSSSLSSGYNNKMGTGDKIKFSLNSENHTLTVSAVLANKTTITIQSTPLTITLNKGEERKFNLSSPEYYNLYVKINNIENYKANLTIKTIWEKISLTSQVGELTDKDLKVISEEKQEKIFFRPELFIWIIGIVILIIIGFVFYHYKKFIIGLFGMKEKNKKRSINSFRSNRRVFNI
jgi:subtilisin family serine protease